jgi:hypothetical protein
MQRYTKESSFLEASHNEILMDFKLIIGNDADKVVSGLEGKARGRQKKEKHAVCGVLGLASLIGDRDGKEHKIPNDWFQPYPLTYRNSNEILPTGIPLQGRGLLDASFDIYYRGLI